MKIFLVSMAVALLLYWEPGFVCFGVLLYVTLTFVSKYGKTGEELEREKRPSPPKDISIERTEPIILDAQTEKIPGVEFYPDFRSDPIWQEKKASLDKHMAEVRRKRFAEEGIEEQTV